MQRRPDEPELMGAQEAALTLGVAQSNLRTVAGLPTPYGKLAATTMWRADEIRSLAWKRQYNKARVLIKDPGENTHPEAVT
jgi:hypothetical protein